MKCERGGIGRHAGLRSQYFGVRVRVSPLAPYRNTLILGSGAMSDRYSLPPVGAG